MRKVAFYTLGCKLNYSESSTISRQFKAKGFEVVHFEEPADAFIINTCSVTENADRKCRKIVRDALRNSPEALIAVIGCYAQLKPKEISEIPGVGLVLGASEKFRLPEILSTLITSEEPLVMACDIAKVKTYNSSYSIADRTRSFLKVQDGCDYGCSFCTIPLARGMSRSDTIENVLKQAEEIAQAGGKEIVLTGVNTGDFGIIDGVRKTKFIHLIQALEQVSGIRRIRISSIEPNLLNPEIISWVAHSNKFVPHFHIPLQSGSDFILKKMRRRYLTSLYQDRIYSIKELIPDCCIGADVMVGFPGETKQHFLETYEFLRNLPLSYLHVFTYSERANTLAAEMPSPVPHSIRSERSRMLRILSDKKRREFYREHLQSLRTVLVENDLANGYMFGFTENYIRVGLPYDKSLINQLVEVKLSGINESGNVIGEILEMETI